MLIQWSSVRRAPANHQAITPVALEGPDEVRCRGFDDHKDACAVS